MSLSRQDTSGEEREREKKKLTDCTVRLSSQIASEKLFPPRSRTHLFQDNTSLTSARRKDLDKDIAEVEGGDHKDQTITG